MLQLESLKAFHNQLEPYSIIDTFTTCPPENFKIELLKSHQQYFHAFSADFDLLSTVDESLVEFINKLRAFKLFNYINKTLLTPETTFIGTTVSEYSLFPNNTTPKEFSTLLISYMQEHDSKYFIVKDIPLSSPLLSEEENNFSRELMQDLEKCDFQIMSGQALAYLPINFSSLDEYLKSFSSKRRYDFRRKIKSLKKISASEHNTGDGFFTQNVVSELYTLYLNVFNNSYVNFDKLTLSFFKQLFQNTYDGKVFIYSDNNKILGFNLCYIFNNKLINKYCGFSYPEAHDFYLFFNHFFDNINYCVKNNLSTYIIGGAAPRVKAYLGCDFTFTYHAVYFKNPILRYSLKKLKHLFEFDNNVLNSEQL